MMKLTKASAKEALKPIEDTKDATKTVSSSTKQVNYYNNFIKKFSRKQLLLSDLI